MIGSRLGRTVGVCACAILVVTLVTLRPLGPGPEPRVATHACTDLTMTSLVASGELKSTGAAVPSRRGFVFVEGTTGEPELTPIPLSNASFEEGDPPEGWNVIGGTAFREGTIVKAGDYSVGYITREGQWDSLVQTDPVAPAQVSGRTITFGAWLWSDTPDRLRVFVRYWVCVDRHEVASEYHPGDGTWRWITLTMTFRSGVTSWEARAINTSPGEKITVYADGVFAAYDAVFEDGRFGTGAYSLEITGLKPDTSYRVRAFAENESGTAYGCVVPCGTMP